MASKGRGVCSFTDEDVRSVGRFVYDVLIFTLPKCGLPKDRLPTTDVTENEYHRPNFIKIAGVSALRISLVMRDKWKRMFESRRKTSGLTDKEIPTFLTSIVRCCPLSRESTMQTMVEVILAACNEITMFFYSENCISNINTVMGSVGYIIVNVIGPNQNVMKTLQELFDSFDNVGVYTEWITDFMAKFAIPYGSRNDVSELFFQEIKKEHLNCIKRVKVRAKADDQPIKKLRDRLGFLPHDLYSTIVAEESGSFQENLLASGSTLPGDRDSPEPPNLPPISKSGIADERKSRSRKLSRSKKTSEKSIPLPKTLAAPSSFMLPDNPPKLHACSESGGLDKKQPDKRREKRFEEATQGSQKSKTSSEFRMQHNLPQMSSASAGLSRETLYHPVLSDRASKAESGPDEDHPRGRSEKAPEHTHPSETGIEDDLRQMSLVDDAVSRANQGAIPKKETDK